MPLILIGEEREAHTWTAEEYKAAVRDYMESCGYAQTVDSYVEGTVEDMVFVPAGQLGLPQVRVEAKNTSLSLSNPDLKREVGHHLKSWLAQPESGRFDFYIFARELVNQLKWRALFRETTVEAIREFLSLMGPDSDARLRELAEARGPDVLTFFSRTFVVRGTADQLRQAANRKAETSLGSGLRWAEELKKRMDRRVSLGPSPDILVANLVLVRFPTSLTIVDVALDYLEDVVETLGIEATPPCRMLSKRKLLTLPSDDALNALASVRTGATRNTSPENIRIEHPGALASLVHQYIGKIAIAKGACCEQDEFFFPAIAKGGRLQPFTVPGIKDNAVSLAEPKLISQESRRTSGELAPGVKSRRLNFVVHSGFRFRVEEIWNGTYVAFIPHRIYSRDGIHRLDPKAVQRIDRRFRDPRFNRASSQLTKLQGTVDYLFSRQNLWVRRPPPWFGALRLDYPELGPSPDRVARSLVRIQTRWKPNPEATGEPTLEEYVEEIGADEA